VRIRNIGDTIIRSSWEPAEAREKRSEKIGKRDSERQKATPRDASRMLRYSDVIF